MSFKLSGPCIEFCSKPLIPTSSKVSCPFFVRCFALGVLSPVSSAKRFFIVENCIIEKLKKDTEPEVRQFEFEGWVDDVGGILFRPASHSLKKGNEVLFYLKSDSINLDDYAGKHVGVNGEMNRFRGWGRIMNVKEIKVLQEMPSQFWTAE